jgi:hypothetical protein
MPDNIRSTLQRALTKLTSEKVHIDLNIAALETALGALGGGRGGSRGRPRRRRMSSAARKAIGRRMKAYWAKRRMKSSKTAKAG